MNLERCGRMRQCPNMRQNPEICLQRLRQNVRKDTHEHWEFRSRYDPAPPPSPRTQYRSITADDAVLKRPTTHFAAVSSSRLDISQIRPIFSVETSRIKCSATKVTFQNNEHFSPSIQRLLRDLGMQYAYHVVKSSYIWRTK